MNIAFLSRLEQTVQPGSVLRDPAALIAYETDALPHLRAIPGAVVVPESAAEVQAVVRLCHAEGVPFVARGHGTGLSGGALPSRRRHTGRDLHEPCGPAVRQAPPR